MPMKRIMIVDDAAGNHVLGNGTAGNGSECPAGRSTGLFGEAFPERTSQRLNHEGFSDIGCIQRSREFRIAEVRRLWIISTNISTPSGM